MQIKGQQSDVPNTKEKTPMPLKLMYITNRQDVARVAENAGVDRIFVDLEHIDKALRQYGMDTVQSHHTIEDVKNIRQVVTKAELLVRCNPIHNATDRYCSSEDEINEIIENGADIVMLPFFKTVEEVKRFLSIVGGRARCMLLLETPEASDKVDDILSLDGIDYVHVGINDLSIGYRKKFMFELLADGTIERLCARIKKYNIPYGFGGIAAIGQGALPAENIIMEHYRLGSTCAILSRLFCNTEIITDIDTIKGFFDKGIKEIRAFERKCEHGDCPFEENKQIIKERIKTIVEKI